ncbi:hypothetical protein DSECCO2_120250 [anaerobic digester metagenome]
MIHTIYKPIHYVQWDGTNFVEILGFTKTYCYVIGDTLYFNNIPLEKGTIIFKEENNLRILSEEDFNKYAEGCIRNIFIPPVTSKIVAPIYSTYPIHDNTGTNVHNYPTSPTNVPPFNDVWYGC